LTKVEVTIHAASSRPKATPIGMNPMVRIG